VRLSTGSRADVALAGGLAAAALLERSLDPATGTLSGPPAVSVPLTLAMTLPLAWRRRAPFAVGMWVLTANTVGAVILAEPLGAASLFVAWLCALYTLIVGTGPRTFAVGVAATVASFLLIAAGAPDARPNLEAWLLATVLGMVLVRRIVRGRDARAEALARHAALLDRERELHEREAVLDERARIARELHDVVAHEVSMIVVQAGAERRVLPDDAGSTRDTLSTIERTGRHALGEMRSLLGLRLRSDEVVPLAPVPSLRDVGALVERVRAAGLDVQLSVEGAERELPAGLDVSAYRIVQEALTNAVKHAGGAAAVATVRYGPGTVEIEVRDDGAGAGPRSPDADAVGGGHGLVGMRERAELYGGRLEAGPLPGGGFAVHAVLPEPA
jgi:signal transduction histidine kinase